MEGSWGFPSSPAMRKAAGPHEPRTQMLLGFSPRANGIHTLSLESCFSQAGDLDANSSQTLQLKNYTIRED